MASEQLTYFEKLEKIYILTETRQMLRKKLVELETNNQPLEPISDDIHKIEQEIILYTDGQPIEDLDFSNTTLLNPALYTSFED